MYIFWNKRYLPLVEGNTDSDADEATDSLLTSTSTLYRWSKPSILHRLPIWTILNLAILLSSVSLFGSWWYQTKYVRNAAYREVAGYSPMFDYLDIDTVPTKMNGTFLTPPNPPFSRQMPNPEADEVWDEILIDRFIPVTREQIIKLGKDPSTVVQLLDRDWGLGDNAYVAGLDVFHQLHCVDLLRRIAYTGYYNDTPPLRTTGRPRIAEYHVNHCVDLLVQQLQCSANFHLFTMHWVKTERFPAPDFSVHRQCPNFQDLWDWRMRNTLDPHRFKEVFGSGIKPDGIRQAPNLAALDT